ncbi:MAG: hypothetical protein QOI12_1252 [Alphaproteobacteria bacterium]|nr:hypothetical protein [Alphaproteobacteria bacterium]
MGRIFGRKTRFHFSPKMLSFGAAAAIGPARNCGRRGACRLSAIRDMPSFSSATHEERRPADIDHPCRSR